jgi:hypothetical protein
MAILNGVLTLGIAVGVLMVLLNLVDFIVRPFQRQAIQRFFEDLTLWIDDAENTLHLKIVSKEYKVLVVVSVWWFGCVIATIIHAANTIFSIGFFESAANLGHQIAAIILLLLLYERGLGRVLDWLSVGRAQARRIVFLLLSMSALPIVFLSVYLTSMAVLVVASLRMSPEEVAEWRHVPADLTSSFTGVYFTLVVNIMICGAVMATIRSGQRESIVTFFVRIASACLWRIVEFQKGAVAALVALATAALGFLKLYLS